MNKEQELAHLHAPSSDPKQRMIDYWGQRAERAEAMIGRILTDAQKEWLKAHPDYTSVGPPRPGVYFRESGTLYADGTFEPLAPMKPIVLRPGCFGVGIPTPLSTTRREGD